MNDIFDEFCKTWPIAAKRVARWYPGNQFEIVVELEDGSVMLYDQIMKACWSANSLEELNEKRTPRNEAEWKKEFAIRLYRKMKINGFTQDDLAWEADISQASITKYVNGVATPSAYNLVKIARALGLTMEELAKMICL